MTCRLCKNGEMLCGDLDPPPSRANLIGRRMTFRMCPEQAGVDTVTGVVTGADFNSVKVGERYIRDRHVISMEETPPRHWRAMAFVFRLIRPLFVEDVDLNEDYNCGVCGKPVLRRYLTCSKKCSEEFDKL